jgi:DNA mismatch endonuclease (patch repair protein)
MNKSEQMSRVRSCGTQPELYLRRALWKRGVRYRLHRKDLPGRPDLYVARLRLAIFVNGCFWHGHDCPRGRRPSTNITFWNAKINRNRDRDLENIRILCERGIVSLTLWTCWLKDFDRFADEIELRYHSTRRSLSRTCSASRPWATSHLANAGRHVASTSNRIRHYAAPDGHFAALRTQVFKCSRDVARLECRVVFEYSLRLPLAAKRSKGASARFRR